MSLGMSNVPPPTFFVVMGTTLLVSYRTGGQRVSNHATKPSQRTGLAINVHKDVHNSKWTCA